MKSDTRVFVCYTRRDGYVTKSLLERLSENLDEICVPFIHLVHSRHEDMEQLRVIKMLVRSHVLLLIESPYVYKSSWVILELILSRIFLIPMIRIPVEDVSV